MYLSLVIVNSASDLCDVSRTLQSDRFFTALKGHGSLCRLVILPFESHGYSARESIMHVLWETDRWLQKYCVNNSSKLADLDASTGAASVDSENKALSSSGGGPAQECSNLGDSHWSPRSLLW